MDIGSRKRDNNRDDGGQSLLIRESERGIGERKKTIVAESQN